MKTVIIKAKREITYDVIVEISNEHFDKIKKINSDDVDLTKYEQYVILEEHLEEEGIIADEFQDVEIKQIRTT
ncbi:hypothetical protein JIP32914_220039 [Tenacibaculum maritimum]|uniref:hypothetical protein n=1 Tax=Tenacibaculum maritimum TaxID=107401 RepID=UPI0012E5F218|nr:hypothetical protein [Tenacibaculum maritimum]CAA0196706.1 hypothetical protein JIP32914_220039 [Tenacibaculum maritimum]